MIYCGKAPDYCGDADEIDVSLCTIDDWGFTDCSAAGCPPSDGYPEPCYNLYRSIPMASYYSLLNLFGEFPLVDQHGVGGKIIGTIVAIVAVAIFALPSSIIGNGFESIVEQRHEEKLAQIAEEGEPEEDGSGITAGYVATGSDSKSYWYNFLHAQTEGGSAAFDLFLNFLVVGTALTFAIDSMAGISGGFHMTMDTFELLAVTIFTFDYVMRTWSATQDPNFAGPGGMFTYMCSFLAIVDLLTVLPYWIEVGLTGEVITPTADTATLSLIVKSLRLFRLLRFEKYTKAFSTFDDVISENKDVLAMTGFAAIIIWIFLGSMLYFTERDNPDPEMASNYKSVPDAMWMTLLNLSGESPLAQYSVWGKIITGALGLLATGIFGIPIGVLGAGFEQIVEERAADVEEEEEEEDFLGRGSALEIWCFDFVNGQGSQFAEFFEMGIYWLIALSVAVGIWQTVEGHEDDFGSLEWFSVIVFTIEYTIRFIGVPADPLWDDKGNWLVCRLRFIGSFYSVIDLLAIVPFYISVAMPGSWVDDYDEMFRMLRLLRLIKLDKYIPSITLIDDVIRLKRNSLKIAGFAAITLWIIFAAFLYIFEVHDTTNEIDNVPKYGCDSDCTMSDRFQNFWDSVIYTGVHLTGDYPITTYTWPARFVNFFMVIAAVGVVSIPSGLVASGFTTLVGSKAKVKSGAISADEIAGDDWYEIRLRELKDVPAPPSAMGESMDRAQIAVNEFLNGREDGTWSTFAFGSRIFIFSVIILNVLAVLLESVPEIDRAIGNGSGNFFDRFEAFSVAIFASEYALRLFCAPKNRESLYSSVVYASTFFGIVDFLSTAPWFIEQLLISLDMLSADSEQAKIFRIFRIFRMLQLEDFITAFSKLDNVFRASKDVLKATGLMAMIIWVGCAALFYLFEENNPNWRSCDMSIPLHTDDPSFPGCYDFNSTNACNEFYPGMCSQAAFTNVPNSLYYVAVFLGGEWGVIDFTWPGRFVCMFLCVAGIGLYAIPIGTLFDSFGVVLGFDDDDDEEDDDADSRVMA